MRLAVTSLRAAVALEVAALALPALAALAASGAGAAPLLLTAAVTALGWELVFAQGRGRTFAGHGLATALIVFVFLPQGLPLWQVALATSFGVVLAEQVFGGRGYGFVNTAAATLAFLGFSFPDALPVTPGLAVAATTIPGAVLLLVAGLISWRVLLAACAGFVAVAVVLGAPPAAGSAALAFGLVFMVCDPFGAASTQPGRWIYGVLAGALAGWFGSETLLVPAASAVVFATLLANLFAPLIDQVVIEAGIVRRRRRHG